MSAIGSVINRESTAPVVMSGGYSTAALGGTAGVGVAGVGVARKSVTRRV